MIKGLSMLVAAVFCLISLNVFGANEPNLVAADRVGFDYESPISCVSQAKIQGVEFVRSLSAVDQGTQVAFGCCKVCTKGQACGDSCISWDKQCTKGPGCACQG
jgi:hypothetical protein